MRALWSPFLFCGSFSWMQFLACMVGGQGVGASALRLTSRAAVRILCCCFVNAGRALTLRGNREWSLRPDYPNHLPRGRTGAPAEVPLLSVRPYEFEGGWCGLTGAGSIRGCHKVSGPTAPLTNRRKRTRSSRPRGEQEHGSSTIRLARGVGGECNECKQNGRTKPAVWMQGRSAYLPSSLNTSRAAETVSAMSCAVCAALTNPASYSAGAMYTPRSSRPWNRVLKRGPSVVMTLA